MKFLLDAQLPRRLAFLLRERVATKDSGFVDSLLLRGQPWKLLSVTTGNIHNRELEALSLENFETIVNGLDVHTYVVGRTYRGPGIRCSR